MGKLGRRLLVSTIGIAVGLLVTKPTYAADCPKDSVRAGTVCIDKYEASVWQIKPQDGATSLSKDQLQVIDKIRDGSVTLTDLSKVGAVQLGILDGLTPVHGFVEAGCPLSGKGCTNVYAVSVAGVKPSGNVTWPQAAAAARNSFKRLPTNAEWTAAALGTPDGVSDNGTTSCNTDTIDATTQRALPVNAGSRTECVSDVGVYDMVGNMIEWVADWVPRSDDTAQDCGGIVGWYDANGFDGNGYQCLLGAKTTGDPGALWRGGGVTEHGSAGVFAISGLNSPISFDYALGFRAVR